MPVEKNALPEKYYLEHFNFFINFIKKYYLDLLNENEKQFIYAFEKLSTDGKSLMARLYNRKATFFEIELISYPEISSISEAWRELFNLKLIEKIIDKSELNLLDFLNSRNRNDLFKACLYFNVLISNTASKASLIQALLAMKNCEFELINYFSKDKQIICLTMKAEFLLLRFLLFGNLSQTLSEFAVEDMKAKPSFYKDKHYSPAFKTRTEIDDVFAIHKAYAEFKYYRDTLPPIDVYCWFMMCKKSHANLAEAALTPYDKLVVKLGLFLEKQNLFDQAISVFALTTMPPARERQVRILMKLKQKEKAAEICKNMLKNYHDAQEYNFAKDFLNKMTYKKANKATTHYLKNSEKITLHSDISLKPEVAVINHLKGLGSDALYTENYLWRALFGLVFWDLLFDADLEYLHYPLQKLPADLYKGKFYINRKIEILQRIEILNDGMHSLQSLKERYFLHYGIDNTIISWHPDLWLAIENCFKFLNSIQLKQVLLEMAMDWKNNSKGFPDLFSWNQHDYCFIEVKSANDNLSSQQLKWINFFSEIKIKAKVLQVN